MSGLKIVGYHDMPAMPAGIAPDSQLNLYLKQRAEEKIRRLRSGDIKLKEASRKEQSDF